MINTTDVRRYWLEDTQLACRSEEYSMNLGGNGLYWHEFQQVYNEYQSDGIERL